MGEIYLCPVPFPMLLVFAHFIACDCSFYPFHRTTIVKKTIIRHAVAGVIGRRSPKYSVFGDTVNTASRMATTQARNKA